MTAQSAGAADASAENHVDHPNAEPANNGGKQQQEQLQSQEQQTPAVSDRLAQILGGETDLPEDVRESELKAAAEESQKEESESKEKSAPAPKQQEQQPPAAPKAKDEDHPMPNEWPEEARAQVMEDRRKRKERTEERDRAIRERDDIKTELEKSKVKITELSQQRPAAPTAASPLAHLTSEEQLQQAERDAQEILDFTERNPDGVEDLVIGRHQRTGEEIKVSYTPAQIREMKIEARRTRDAIPTRRQAIANEAALQTAHGQSETAAKEIWPEMFEEGKPDNKAFTEVVEMMPALKQVPDYHIWVGHAIEGFKLHVADAASLRQVAQRLIERATALESKNGKGSPTVQALREQQRAPKVPAAPTTRMPTAKSEAPGSSQRSGDVVKQKERDVIDNGGDENAEEVLVAELLEEGRRNRGPQTALV